MAPLQAWIEKDHARLKLALAVLAVLGLFALMNPAFLHGLLLLKTVKGKGVFLLTALLAWGALGSCIFAGRAWLAPFLLFFSINMWVSATFSWVMGRSMSLNDAQNLLEARGNLMDAVHQFGGAVWLSAQLVVATVALVLWARRQTRTRTALPLLACTLAVAVSYGASLVKGRGEILFFAADFGPGLHALTLSLEPAINRVMRKDNPPIPVLEWAVDPSVRHIVLIIDESIEAHVFAETLQGAALANARDLGLAYSFANNSAGSNLMLRRAADPVAPEQSLRQFPSLLELARKHGFTTSYVDAQGVLSDHSVQNYFDEREKSFINVIPSLNGFGPRYARDLNALGVLRELLRHEGPTFTVMNKQGSHIPYPENLPPELAQLPDPYRRSVLRSSIGFLAALGEALPPGTLVFYTSDHGQNFQARFPHNNIPGECSVAEWQVPLVILRSPDLGPWTDRIPADWQGLATHGAMTETLRNLLGQRDPAQRSLLERPAAEDVARVRVFYGSPKGLFGFPVQSLWIDKQRQALTSARP